MKTNAIDIMKDKYGSNYPIFLSDFPDSNSAATRQYVSRCVKQGLLKRYRNGIYYFPTQTRWGSSLLSPVDVCRRKYISDGNRVFGYISGTFFENEAGLTQQVPNEIVIRTDETASRRRRFTLDGQQFVLMKSRVPVTAGNWKELQFLDMLNDMPQAALEKNRLNVLRYCKENGLSRQVIRESLAYYPGKVSRRVLEEGIYDVLA